MANRSRFPQNKIPSSSCRFPACAKPASAAKQGRRYPDVPLMLEHLDDTGYARARDHIFSVGDEIGVGFVGRA